MTFQNRCQQFRPQLHWITRTTAIFKISRFTS